MAREIVLSASYRRHHSLGAGRIVIVDDADYDDVSKFKWSITHANRIGGGYAVRRIPGHKTIMLHTQIMNPPVGMEVDHINGNTLDNRRENLRVVTRSENLRNRRKFKTNTSGHTNIAFDTKTGEYLLRIQARFRSLDDALIARDSVYKAQNRLVENGAGIISNA